MDNRLTPVLFTPVRRSDIRIIAHWQAKRIGAAMNASTRSDVTDPSQNIGSDLVIKTFFSDHGLRRAWERSSVITIPEMIKILDTGLYVPVGRDRGTDREHRLFYSLDDRFHLVAVQDKVNHEVVTILGPRFRSSMAEDAMRMAMQMIEQNPVEISRAERYGNYYVICRAYSHEFGHEINHKLIACPIADYGNIKSLIGSRTFRDDLVAALKKKNLQRLIKVIYISKTRSGKPRPYTLNEVFNSNN